MKEFRLSIIIPTYNERGKLNTLLQEIIRRSADGPHEIIIADGGSNDGTLQSVSDPSAKKIRCTRRGRASQMNEGAEHATGNYLFFLHADTLPPDKFDRKIGQAIRRGFECGCFRLSFDDPHPLLRLYAWFTRFRSTLVRFGDQSLFVSKDLFKNVDGFDEELVIMEDQKIVRNLKKHSAFVLLDEKVITSARKYRDNGVFRLQMIFTLITLLYYLGAGQPILIDVYNRFVRRDFR